jgi:hypothetical protein
MSTIETILYRMMSEPVFADAVFTDAETALAEYDLSAEEVMKFKGLSRAQFDVMTPGERKSMSLGSMETMKKAWKDG